MFVHTEVSSELMHWFRWYIIFLPLNMFKEATGYQKIWYFGDNIFGGEGWVF